MLGRDRNSSGSSVLGSIRRSARPADWSIQRFALGVIPTAPDWSLAWVRGNPPKVTRGDDKGRRVVMTSRVGGSVRNGSVRGIVSRVMPSARSMPAGRGWPSTSTSRTSSSGWSRNSSVLVVPRIGEMDQEERVRNEPGSMSIAIFPCIDSKGASCMPGSATIRQLSSIRDRGVRWAESRERFPSAIGATVTRWSSPARASTTRLPISSSTDVFAASGIAKSRR